MVDYVNTVFDLMAVLSSMPHNKKLIGIGPDQCGYDTTIGEGVAIYEGDKYVYVGYSEKEEKDIIKLANESHRV